MTTARFREGDPMTTVSTPSADADEAYGALDRLAHATRSIDDPTEIRAVLGSLPQGLAALAQTLHQLGQFHDGPARTKGWTTGDPRTARAVSYQIAWELHRAAEIVHQAATGIDRAREVEATIPAEGHDLPLLINNTAAASEPGPVL
jgi:hypothetical protein